VIRRLLPLSLFLLVGAVFAPDALADDGDRTVWEDHATLRRFLDAACDAVEQACEAPFTQRPSVRISTQQEVDAILSRQLVGEEGMGETPSENRNFIAYYEPKTFTIHVLPAGLQSLSETFGLPQILGEDVLRIVLVHEATHALDFQRFPMQWTLACCGGPDERLAIEAVLEGHAQLVAEQIARRWEVEEAFQALTCLYTGGCPTDEGEEVAFDQEAAFTYLQGHAFMRTVFTHGGREAVDAVLLNPPAVSSVIDRPMLWLDPTLRGQEHDLQALLEVFRPLVRASDWSVSKWRVLGPAGGVLIEGTAPGAPAAMEGYVDNHSLYAGAPDGNRYLNVFIAKCPSETAAARLVEALRDVDQGRDAEPGWEPPVREQGAGAGGTLRGFTTRRRPVGRALPPELILQVVQEGVYVIELTAYGAPGASRPAQDQALGYAVRLLRAPPPVTAAVALRSHVRAFLAARANGRAQEARFLLREMLPTAADLRRLVRPAEADGFLAGHLGVRLSDRSMIVPDTAVANAFRIAGPETSVRAWGATTEELREGGERASRFPPEMLEFARTKAAPGLTWLLLVLTPEGGESATYVSFVRHADRFLWVVDPWRAFAE
jgi:hypothetical protein